jgi:hypothetical protein
VEKEEESRKEKKKRWMDDQYSKQTGGHITWNRDDSHLQHVILQSEEVAGRLKVSEAYM